MKNGDSSNQNQLVFNSEAVSIVRLLMEHDMESLIGGAPSKTASVKFMLTMQDENNLRNLGYCKEHIDKMKPQEAADIIQSATKAGR